MEDKDIGRVLLGGSASQRTKIVAGADLARRNARKNCFHTAPLASEKVAACGGDRHSHLP